MVSTRRHCGSSAAVGGGGGPSVGHFNQLEPIGDRAGAEQDASRPIHDVKSAASWGGDCVSVPFC
jgi:hypothetical protein